MLLKLVIFLISLLPYERPVQGPVPSARRRILVMLREKPMTSGDIAAAFDMAWPSITAHLTALKDAGLVEAERNGTSIRYRLVISAAEEAAAFLMGLMGAGEDATASNLDGKKTS